MKCNPLRWLWGLIPIGLLTWLTVLGEHQRIENDLAMRVRDLFARQKLEWASTSFSGRDAVLTGDSSEDDDQRKAFEVARSTWGVRTVVDKSKLLDEEKNYILSAVLRDDKVRLSGFAPSEASRKAVLAAAKATFPGKPVDDALKLARGAPKGDAWLNGVNFGLKQLAGLKSGKVDLEALSLVVEGEAIDQTAYRSVKGSLASAMPQNVRRKSEEVIAPLAKPYLWTAKPQGNQLVLTGHVPSDRQREEVVALAKRLYPRLTVVDRMQLASGEPRDWSRAVSTALNEMVPLENPSSALKDSELTIAGVAPDQGYLGGVRQALRRDVPGSYRLVDQLKFKEPVIKPVSPFTTSVEVQAQSIIVTGYVPNEAGKKSLLDEVAARLTGKRVEDRLQIADGAPQGWAGCAQAGVQGLGRVGNGRLQMIDRALVLTGATENEAIASAVPSEVRTAVGSACDADVRIALNVIAEPVLTWSAKHAGGELVLDGEVPDAATRTSLLASTSRLFPTAKVVDRMRVNQTPARRWPSVAESGLAMLGRLLSGEARIVGPELSITGEAAEAGIVEAVKAQLAGAVGRGYRGREAVTVKVAVATPPPPPPPPAASAVDPDAARKAADEAARRAAEEKARAEQEKIRAEREAKLKAQQAALAQCQASLSAAVKDGAINFKRASADIEATSFPTLDKLARIAISCPDARIEVEGHTDAEGTPERNHALSNRRASAVLTYLAKAGVEQQRLTSAGYGETKPVAPNDTPANRALNRRIEITVKTQ